MSDPNQITPAPGAVSSDKISQHQMQSAKSEKSVKEDEEECTIFTCLCSIVDHIDTILLLLTLLAQSLLINFFFIRNHEESFWYFWFIVDAFTGIITLVTIYLSANYLQVKIPKFLDFPIITQIRKTPRGVLPYGIVFWLPYSLTLVTKVVVASSAGFLEDLPSRGVYTKVTFLFYIGLTCPTFLFILKTHRDPRVDMTHDVIEYLADMGSRTSLEIFDSIDMMSHIFDKNLSTDLINITLVLSSVSLVLPFMALMKLGLEEKDTAKRTISVYLLYSTIRLILIDVPYLFIRLYIAIFKNEISIFGLKNALNIMIDARYLIPEYIRTWRGSIYLDDDEEEAEKKKLKDKENDVEV